MPTTYPLASADLRAVKSDHLTVREINGMVVLSFPHDVTLDDGVARVSKTGQVEFVANDGWMPPDLGITIILGQFLFALWDGSQVRRRGRTVVTFTGTEPGSNTAPSASSQTVTFTVPASS